MSKVSEPIGIMYHLPDGKRYYALTLPGRTEGTFRVKDNAETLVMELEEETLFSVRLALFVDGKLAWAGRRHQVTTVRGRRYPGVIHQFLGA